MSAIQQVVLHPHISATLRFWSTTVGRDKTYRTIQYLARFLAWYTYRKGATKETVERWTALKSQLALSRKLMRVGKFMEHLQAALKAASVQDPVLAYTALGRQFGYAVYLVFDTLQWVQGSKAYTFSQARYTFIANNAARFWLFGLLFSIASGGYKIRALQVREKKAKKARPTAEKEAERKVEIRAIQSERAAVRYQLTQDLLDTLIPATTLGYLNLDEGALGIAGFITSVMGGLTQWKAVNGGGVKSK